MARGCLLNYVILSGGEAEDFVFPGQWARAQSKDLAAIFAKLCGERDFFFAGPTRRCPGENDFSLFCQPVSV